MTHVIRKLLMHTRPLEDVDDEAAMDPSRSSTTPFQEGRSRLRNCDE